ncbi:hypothetical protein KAR02_10475 [Candidatus Bipolaricaulota bacterium]|nr:hypothetical protein [Candidatus Bipolaricaulota bacterium]
MQSCKTVYRLIELCAMGRCPVEGAFMECPQQRQSRLLFSRAFAPTFSSISKKTGLGEYLNEVLEELGPGTIGGSSE